MVLKSFYNLLLILSTDPNIQFKICLRKWLKWSFALWVIYDSLYNPFPRNVSSIIIYTILFCKPFSSKDSLVSKRDITFWLDRHIHQICILNQTTNRRNNFETCWKPIHSVLVVKNSKIQNHLNKLLQRFRLFLNQK